MFKSIFTKIVTEKNCTFIENNELFNEIKSYSPKRAIEKILNFINTNETPDSLAISLYLLNQLHNNNISASLVQYTHISACNKSTRYAICYEECNNHYICDIATAIFVYNILKEAINLNIMYYTYGQIPLKSFYMEHMKYNEFIIIFPEFTFTESCNFDEFLSTCAIEYKFI